VKPEGEVDLSGLLTTGIAIRWSPALQGCGPQCTCCRISCRWPMFWKLRVESIQSMRLPSPG